MGWLRRALCGWTTFTPHELTVTPRSVHAFVTDCAVCGERRWGVEGQRGTLAITADVESMFMRFEREEAGRAALGEGM
jgi:hypothetical protein